MRNLHKTRKTCRPHAISLASVRRGSARSALLGSRVDELQRKSVKKRLSTRRKRLHVKSTTSGYKCYVPSSSSFQASMLYRRQHETNGLSPCILIYRQSLKPDRQRKAQHMNPLLKRWRGRMMRKRRRKKWSLRRKRTKKIALALLHA